MGSTSSIPPSTAPTLKRQPTRSNVDKREREREREMRTTTAAAAAIIMNRKAECNTQHGMIGSCTWFEWWFVPEREKFLGGRGHTHYYFLKRVWNRALLLCHDSKPRYRLSQKIIGWRWKILVQLLCMCVLICVRVWWKAYLYKRHPIRMKAIFFFLQPTLLSHSHSRSLSFFLFLFQLLFSFALSSCRLWIIPSLVAKDLSL